MLCQLVAVWLLSRFLRSLCLFFFNDTATTEIYTLSLHDALPISQITSPLRGVVYSLRAKRIGEETITLRSEEHTSELQSLTNLVCRLLLEKKKKHPTTRSSVILPPRPRRSSTRRSQCAHVATPVS